MNYKIYGGTVDLEYIDSKHLYLVNNKKVDGVTSILGVLAKPALMYWAVNMTIEFFKGALKPGMALDELKIQALLVDGKLAHRKKKDAAADFGTMVHEWIEKHIKGENPKPFVNEKLKNSCDKFLRWEKENKVEYIANERIVYSKKHNYAGKFDFLAKIDGKLWMGDIKTSSGIWDEYWFQTAAYRQAYVEENPGTKFTGEMIVRIGKDGDEVEIKKSTDEFVTPYWINKNAFNHALKLYHTLAKLKTFKYQSSNGTKIQRSSI